VQEITNLTIVYVVSLLTLGACTWFAVLLGLLDRRVKQQVDRLVIARTANLDHDCEKIKADSAEAIKAIEEDRDHYLRKLQESENNFLQMRQQYAKDRNRMQEQLADAFREGEEELARERKRAAEEIAHAAEENRRLAAEAEVRIADALKAAEASHNDQLKRVAEGVLKLHNESGALLSNIIAYVDGKSDGE
jgi:membrane protein involved in colicin uptake